MPIEKIDIETFLDLSKQIPVIDVRSPGEYRHAHIPGAQSLPLFTDEERKVVGTAYKQQSRQEAIKIGLDYFGVKMKTMVESAEAIRRLFKKKTGNNIADSFIIHCWRGGMRSAAVAWLLDLYGYKIYTIAGGYKTYRKWVLAQFEKKYPFKILGGYTGSGKTEVLNELKKQGHAVIDLEGMAGHRGSSFGNIGLPKQVTQEQFENHLALELFEVNRYAREENGIWMEDESHRIGEVNIPPSLWEQMRYAKLYFLDIAFEQRLLLILKMYGHLDKTKMIHAIMRIKKRLGGLDTKEAINALLEERTEDCFRILLHYYDKWYAKGMQNRPDLSQQLIKIPCETVTEKNIHHLLNQHT